MAARSAGTGSGSGFFGELPGYLGQVLVLAGGDVVPDGGDRLACGRVDVTEPGSGLPLGPPVGQRHSVPPVAAQCGQRVREAAVEQVRQGKVKRGVGEGITLSSPAAWEAWASRCGSSRSASVPTL